MSLSLSLYLYLFEIQLLQTHDTTRGSGINAMRLRRHFEITQLNARRINIYIYIYIYIYA